MPTPPIKKTCKGFDECLLFLYKIFTIVFVRDLIFSSLKKIIHMICLQMNYSCHYSSIVYIPNMNGVF
jgi:hypothetical protein